MKEVLEAAKLAGVYVVTHSPGDGVTRYRFHWEASSEYNSGNEIATVLGKKNALLWLSAFRAGRVGA